MLGKWTWHFLSTYEAHGEPLTAYLNMNMQSIIPMSWLVSDIEKRKYNVKLNDSNFTQMFEKALDDRRIEHSTRMLSQFTVRTYNNYTTPFNINF